METRDVVTMETSAENVEVVMATEDTAGAHALTAAVATSKDISKEDAPVTMSNEESGSEGQATDVAMTTTSRLQGAGVGLEFLREVHGYLGGAGQGWCVQDEGCLLKTMVGELRRELQTLTAHSHKTREVRSPDIGLRARGRVGLSTFPSPSLCSDSAARSGAVLLLPLRSPSQEGQGQWRYTCIYLCL